MKFLLVFAVLVVAFYVWRSNRLGDPPQRTGGRHPPPAKVPAIMLACAQCGTHLPETDAVHGPQGVYCSTEHQRLHEQAVHKPPPQ